MQYLKIKNKGEVEVNAFELIGASTKVDDDTKIGMFGSGMNYAVAWLLRNKVDFKAYAGQNEITFGVQEVWMRDKAFSRITVNGVSTSFTITMGKDWKAWFVIREIYCNALDEEDASMEVVDTIDPIQGETHFYLPLIPDIKTVLDDWDMYFSDKRTDIVGQVNGVKVYMGGNDLIVYRKGIMCYHQKNARAMFHYDFDNVDINESRLIDNVWLVKTTIGGFLARDASDKIIKKLLPNMKDTFESTIDWNLYILSDVWERVIGTRPIVETELEGHYADISVGENPFVLPKVLCDELLKYKDNVRHVAGSIGPDGIVVRDTTDQEKYMLKLADAFCKECKYDVTLPILVCDFANSNIIATLHEGTIYLGTKAFMGVQTLIEAIIEEQEHHNSKAEDNSGKFELHLIRLFIGEKCKRFAYTI